MADNVIELIVQVLDQATDQLKGIGDAFGVLKGTFEAFIGGFSLVKIGEGIIQSQAATAQLNAAFAATGATVRVTQDQLTALTAKMVENTTASKPMVQQAEAILLTFNRVKGEAFDQTIEAASELAARFGIDLPVATRLLGRALQEPLQGMNSLQRLGVTLSASQKELIKQFVDTGETAKAQAVILQNIQDRFAGAAEAAKGTLGGALADLKKAFADLFDLDTKQTGGLIDSINELKKTIEDPEFIKSVQTLASTIAGGFEFAAGTINELVETYKGLSIIATGKGGNTAVDIDNQRISTAKQLAKLKQDEAQYDPSGSDQLRIQQIQQLTEKLVGLNQKYEEAINISSRFYNQPTTTKSPGGATIGGANEHDEEELTAIAKTKLEAAKLASTVADDRLKESKQALDLSLQWLDDLKKQFDAAVADSGDATLQIEKKFEAMWNNLNELSAKGIDQDTLNKLATGILKAQGEAEQAQALTEVGPLPADLNLQKQSAQIGLEAKGVATQIFDPKQTQEAQRAIDTLRGGFTRMFEDIHNGWGSMAKDFLDALQRMVSGLLASKLTDLLFGGTTTDEAGIKHTSSGLLGGLLSGIVGGVSGGGGDYYGGGAVHEAFAGGGVTSGGLVTVGETGPENVVLPGGSRVYNAQQWKNSGIGGGVQTLHYAPNYTVGITANDGDKTRQELVTYIEWRSKQDKADMTRTLMRNGVTLR